MIKKRYRHSAGVCLTYNYWCLQNICPPACEPCLAMAKLNTKIYYIHSISTGGRQGGCSVFHTEESVHSYFYIQIVFFFIWANSFWATQIWRMPVWRATRGLDMLRALNRTQSGSRAKGHNEDMKGWVVPGSVDKNDRRTKNTKIECECFCVCGYAYMWKCKRYIQI